MNSLETKLTKIAQHSNKDRNAEFKWLIQLYSKENLVSCFLTLEGRKATGIDKITKVEYEQDLYRNIENLVNKMKRMSYRPKPVKEVLIPKEGSKGKMRPLGISVIEDKMVQKLTALILEAIYEPIFMDCSYGFRPKRNCHMAIKDLKNYLFQNNCKIIIDVDLKNYFGTIDHKILMEFLELKIKDKIFLRYIVRMLKAGVLSDGEFRMTEEGSPQGNIASPVLANIFAHYVIDEWFEQVVKKHVQGKTKMFRYADDIVVCCENENDATRIQKAMKNRLNKYNLQMNMEKTKLVRFDKSDKRKQETFDFLGFTFYLGISKRGYTIPKVKTSGKRMRSKLKRVNLWCKKMRDRMKMKELWLRFTSKLRGHIQYYAVSFNLERVYKFLYYATRLFYKWMNRRSQKRSFNWEKFKRFMKIYPLPKVEVKHSLY